MTHEELLAIIKEKDLSYSHPDSVFTMNDRANKALRAVMELHKPEVQEHGQYEKCWNCNLIYPCPTIQAIEKELD